MPTALFCSHAEDLKLYDPKVHNGLIFDDMNFQHWPRESQIHLVDYEHTRSIHCRYANARILAQTSKIFTTNLKSWMMLNTADEAIRRRTTCWDCSGTPGNLNIVVEYISNIFDVTKNLQNSE